jgi:hypothetical protein
MDGVVGVRLGLFRMKTHTIPPFCRNHLASHTLCYHGLDICRIRFQALFLNTATVRLFLDIARFIATVTLDIPFTSHCLYDYFGTSLSQDTPAVSVLILCKM